MAHHDPTNNIQTWPKLFGLLDFTAGYHQTSLHPASRAYTAFTAVEGLYQWTRVAIGFEGFGPYFQRSMSNTVLTDLVFHICELYIDDVLIHGGDPTTFLANVRKVFSRLREFKVDVNPKKTKLGLEEGEYIGHANTESTVIIHRTRQLLPRSCATHDGDVQSTPCYELQSASKPLSTVNKPSPTTRNSTSSKTP